jgi:hypothetical protein
MPARFLKPRLRVLFHLNRLHRAMDGKVKVGGHINQAE